MKQRKLLQPFLLSCLLAATSQGAIAGGSYHYKHHGGHHGHHDGAALAAGLIIGGLFGYLINDDRRHSSSYEYRDYRSDYHPHPTVVYERVERIPTVIATERNSEFAGQDCMMTREYTTTIRIDGVEKEAYGTRCMTADGSWVLGQPKFMPDL